MEFKYDNKDYKVSELTVKQLTENLTKHVRQQSVKDAQYIAESLKGKEKIDFLNSVWKSLPTDAEILDTIDVWLNSIEGVKYIIEQSITPLIDVDITRINELEPAILYALGKFSDANTVESEEEAPKAVEASEDVPFGEAT